MPARREYVTLFDSGFAARGLALYRSLEEHGGDFRLWVVCMDAEAKALLDRLDAPRLVTVGLDELEARDPALAAVRALRGPVEYCWSATPSVCRLVLAREPSVGAVTYLDADLCFYGSPEPLFAELADASILLVPHRLRDPRNELAHGTYNVGWVTLRNDANGLAALAWWRERCLEWCRARVEPGRFGDQKYLDAWPSLFSGVRACRNPGAGLAPWNQSLHEVAFPGDGTVTVDGRPLVFAHFSGLSFHPAGGWLSRLARRTGTYRLHEGEVSLAWTVVARHDERLLDLLWAPYVARCAAAQAELVRAGAPPTLGLRPLRGRAVALTVAREWSPTWLRDLHLAAYRRVIARRATRRPSSRRASPRRAGMRAASRAAADSSSRAS